MTSSSVGSPSRQAEQLRRWINALAAESLSATDRPRARSPAVAPAANAALLYLGNVHDAVPRALLYDVLLTALDIVTWQAIRIHAGQQGAAKFPSYDDLLQIVKVSKPTLGRAILVLRLTRWLSVVPMTRRNTRGQIIFQGRAYLLHDEPLSVADAQHLDPQYTETARRGAVHRHPAIARAAMAAGAAVARESSSVVAEPLLPSSHLTRRVAEHPMGQVAWIKNFDPGRPAGLGAVAKPCAPEIKNLDAGSLGNREPELDKKFVAASDSSNTTTTKTVSAEVMDSSLADDWSEYEGLMLAAIQEPAERSMLPAAVEWPEPLLAFLHHDENYIGHLDARLRKLPPALAQAVVDEAAGSLTAKFRRGEAVDNPPGYVRALILRAERHQFLPTEYREIGAAMRYERPPVNYAGVLEGASGEALRYAQTGWIAPLPMRDPVTGSGPASKGLPSPAAGSPGTSRHDHAPIQDEE